MAEHTREPRIGAHAGLAFTRRERDVLAVSARGAVSSEVASELGLTEQQVRAALASAMGKLGARSKLEAVVVALRDGAIDLAPGRGDGAA
jgi:DNA-binding NarL/FixJ family response regulator